MYGRVIGVRVGVRKLASDGTMARGRSVEDVIYRSAATGTLGGDRPVVVSAIFSCNRTRGLVGVVLGCLCVCSGYRNSSRLSDVGR